MSPKKTGARRYGNPAKRQQVGDLYRAAQPTGNNDPRKLGGAVAGPGGPRDQSQVVIDATDAVLLDEAVVATIDAFHKGSPAGQRIFMTLSGRINKSTDRAQVGYMFGPDGAAAIISELLALADRFGAELITDLVDRLATLSGEGLADLHFLKAAIDLAIEEIEKNSPIEQ